MADADLSRFTGSETTEVARQADPQKLQRIDKQPDYHQKTAEREGRSEWSGGSWGGRGR